MVPQRETDAELKAKNIRILEELHEARIALTEARAHAAATGQYLSPKDYGILVRRVERLAQESQTIQSKLHNINREWGKKHAEISKSRERLFIQVARQRLPKEVYLDLWEEVDQLITPHPESEP